MSKMLEDFSEKLLYVTAHLAIILLCLITWAFVIAVTVAVVWELLP